MKAYIALNPSKESIHCLIRIQGKHTSFYDPPNWCSWTWAHNIVHYVYIKCRTKQSEGHNQVKQSEGHNQVKQSEGHNQVKQSEGHTQVKQSEGQNQVKQSEGHNQVK